MQPEDIEYHDNNSHTMCCTNCKRCVNLTSANDPGPERCPYCKHQLREPIRNPNAREN